MALLMGGIQSSAAYSSKRSSLLGCLDISRRLKVTDQRDHVFAIIGLADHAGDTSHLIDYSKNVAHVYSSVVNFYLQRFHDLEILSKAGNAENNHRLPSWTPDWSQESKSKNQLQWIFQADGGANAFFWISSDYQKLSLKGMKIDRVRTFRKMEDYVGPATTNTYFDTPDTRCLRQYGTRKDVIEAFLKTIVAGTTGDRDWRRDGNKWTTETPQWCSEILDQIKDEDDGSEVRIPIEIERCGLYSSRRIMVSSQGFLCLMPPRAAADDIICIFAGGRLPFVIRPAANTCYTLIGEAYMNGIMEGEAWDKDELGYFTLV